MRIYKYFGKHHWHIEIWIKSWLFMAEYYFIRLDNHNRFIVKWG